MTNKNLNTAVFYTSATCNLKCAYCGIDKNQSLIQIDKYLENSFKDYDHYFNQIKQYFPHKDSLRRVETWGGEPFLGMERFFPLMHKLIEEYPFLNSFFSSTNFSFKNWDQIFFKLMNEFNKYPNRKFSYSLQLSCDGPEHINDLCRGSGVTAQCLKNFDLLVEKLENNLPPNVSLSMGIKPTLSLESLQFLKTKKDIIKYYQFFEENFIYKIKSLGFINVAMNPTIPNLAVPILATQEDGKNFAEFCKNCREIEKENQLYHYFTFYNSITPFSERNNYCQNRSCYFASSNNCGSCEEMIGFMPDNMISICHEGFTEFLTTYKKEAANSSRINTGIIEFDKFINQSDIRLCIPNEKYEKSLSTVRQFRGDGSKVNLSMATNTIIALAIANQIDSKYLNYEMAVQAAIEYQERLPLCIKDNYNVTGSVALLPIGMFRMLLNGALDYIAQEEKTDV